MIYIGSMKIVKLFNKVFSPLQNNDYSSEEIRIVISIDNVTVKNRLTDGGLFDFPVVLSNKKRPGLICDRFTEKRDSMKYLSQVMLDYSSRRDPAMTVTFIIDKSTYSAPGK